MTQSSHNPEHAAGANPEHATGTHSSQPTGMLPAERRAVFSLASIYALRMMGLFMIFPVFVLYGETLEGNTPFLIGLLIS